MAESSESDGTEKMAKLPEVSSTHPVRVVGITDAAAPVSWYRAPVDEAAAQEGIERRRKENERRRREWRREKARIASEAREGWTRVGKTVAVLAVLVLLGFVYAKLQVTWGNRWPLMDVWLWAAGGVIAVIWWALRQLNKDSS